MPTVHACTSDGRWADHLGGSETTGWGDERVHRVDRIRHRDVPGSVASPTDVSEGMRVEGDDGGWLTTPWMPATSPQKHGASAPVLRT